MRGFLAGILEVLFFLALLAIGSSAGAEKAAMEEAGSPESPVQGLVCDGEGNHTLLTPELTQPGDPGKNDLYGGEGLTGREDPCGGRTVIRTGYQIGADEHGSGAGQAR
jgi:hypothetical protein